MGVFDNLQSNKDNSSTEEIEISSSSEVGCLGDAERMANVVIRGLESENFSGMNRQLSNMSSSDVNKDEYVFEHPDVVGTVIAITICIAASLVTLYYLFISVATFHLSTEYVALGAVGIGTSYAILIVNICLIAKFVSSIRHKTRYDIYNELLGFKSLEFIEDLAICSKQKEPTVIKDLQKAVKQKLIPQGHFSRDNLVFIVSDRVYNKYMEKPAVYDRYFQNKIEERRRVQSRSKRISIIMETGEQYIKKLNDFRTLIKDKTVARKMERLQNVVSMIFHEIDVNPSQAQSLGVFLNYFLPTTEKLLDTYMSITEKRVDGSNLSAAKTEIEEALNTIIGSYESILEKLYEEYEMDISSDIATMEIVMKKEGLPS